MSLFRNQSALSSSSETDRSSEDLSSSDGLSWKIEKDSPFGAIIGNPPRPDPQEPGPSGPSNEREQSERPDVVPPDDKPPSLPELKEAFKWFRLVERMVKRENTGDYVLTYSCSPQALLFMVCYDWIKLQDALAWRHARDLLGEALVMNSTLPNGFQWPRNENIMPHVGEPPSEDEIVAFQNGWPINTDVRKQYDWDEDGYCKIRQGLFGHIVAEYASPAQQVRIYQELQKAHPDLASVDLSEDTKRVFEPLFIKRISNVRPRSTDASQPGAETKDYERASSHQDSTMPREEQTKGKRPVEDDVHTPDEVPDDLSESKRFGRNEKGDGNLSERLVPTPSATTEWPRPTAFQTPFQTGGTQGPKVSSGEPAWPDALLPHPIFFSSVSTGSAPVGRAPDGSSESQRFKWYEKGKAEVCEAFEQTAPVACTMAGGAGLIPTQVPFEADKAQKPESFPFGQPVRPDSMYQCPDPLPNANPGLGQPMPCWTHRHIDSFANSSRSAAPQTHTDPVCQTQDVDMEYLPADGAGLSSGRHYVPLVPSGSFRSTGPRQVAQLPTRQARPATASDSPTSFQTGMWRQATSVRAAPSRTNPVSAHAPTQTANQTTRKQQTNAISPRDLQGTQQTPQATRSAAEEQSSRRIVPLPRRKHLYTPRREMPLMPVLELPPAPLLDHDHARMARTEETRRWLLGKAKGPRPKMKNRKKAFGHHDKQKTDPFTTVPALADAVYQGRAAMDDLVKWQQESAIRI